MKMKWYIHTLIIALTAFGIYQNKISSPNQEILVQFGSEDVSIEQTQIAIENIKQQLKVFGVDVIKVNQSKSGTLTIAYYSSVDVESVKKMLSSDDNLVIDFSKVNHQNNEIPGGKNYNLDIYELDQSTDGTQGAAGTAVISVKQDFDRFSSPTLFLPCSIVNANKVNRFVAEAYKVNKTLAIAIDTISRTIPEVRAGPYTIGNA